jgi:uncharacterized coiled-coil protein SlyX
MDGCRHCIPCALERVEAALARLEPFMASTEQVLSQISDGLTGLEEDVNRLISRLGELTPEQQAAADSILSRLGKLNEQADSAVPPAGPVAKTSDEGLAGPTPNNTTPAAAAEQVRPPAGEDGHPVVDVDQSGEAEQDPDAPQPTAGREDA